jgi:hypothetical protein
VAESRTAPVAAEYRSNASMRGYVTDLYNRMRIRRTSRTTSDEDEGCSCIDNARSGPKNGGRSAVMNGLVDAPEIARRKSLGERTFASQVPCHGKHTESYYKPSSLQAHT